GPGGGAFGDLPFDPHPGVDAREGAVDVRNAANNGLFARDHRGPPARAGRNQRRGQIAAADILRERPFDLLRQVLGNRYRRIHSYSLMWAATHCANLKEWAPGPNTAT